MKKVFAGKPGDCINQGDQHQLKMLLSDYESAFRFMRMTPEYNFRAYAGISPVLMEKTVRVVHSRQHMGKDIYKFCDAINGARGELGDVIRLIEPKGKQVAVSNRIDWSLYLKLLFHGCLNLGPCVAISNLLCFPLCSICFM